MALAQLTNIEKTFGRRVMFDRLNFTIDRGERVGFIGANGSGKTTLFKVLVGEVTPDLGTVAISGGVKIGYLTQDPVFDPENTVIDEAELAFAELHGRAHQMRDLEHEMEHLKDAELDRVLHKYQEVQHEFELLGGYAWQHRLEATLLGVGLERESWEQKVSTLSGGQRSRLALAKLLIGEPELLLLDEPTNHLDLAAIEWLEKYLEDFSGAVVVISHDRYLLDRLATRIVWLTRQKLFSYPGNYSAFIKQRDVQELSQARAYEQQQADIEKQKEFIRRFGAGQRSKEAKGRGKRLDRLLKSDQIIQTVEVQKKIHLSINTDQRAGDQVLVVKELSKRFDTKELWDDVHFSVKRGERIGIIGPNGSGKTTLLKVLLGREDADEGDIKWGANLNIGYYDQRLDEFDPEATVVEQTWEDRPVKEQQVRDILGMLMFRGDDIDKPMGLLSGGERARVRLAQLLLDKPNVLVMDEPTNHLDIASCEALEKTLGQFEGTTLCVSHDRYFLDQTVGRLLVINPPEVADFAGNYSAWMGKQRERAREKAAEKQQKNRPAEKVKEKPRPLQKKEKKGDNPYLRPFGKLSQKDLEKQITETEVAIAECQGMFGEAGSFKDASRGQKLQREYETLAKKLKGLEEEYYLREE
ncbi:MAG TPA: ABC-F family ATP-binding cassette domain-containing protein [Tepidisphaeraceae bacterium]|jgi:ATP-binding cassette subfamily F protein 3